MMLTDALVDWPRDPRAVALLVIMRIEPPPCEARARVYSLTREDWHEYVGRRVDRLAAIRDDYGERALARCFAGDREPMRRWIAAGSVHDVIDAALHAPVIALAAA